MMHRRAMVMMILLAVLCVNPSAAVGQPSQGHGHGTLLPTAATPEQRAAAATLLEEVRAGIARFHEVTVAEAEGYRRSTPFRFGGWGPAHYANSAYGREGQYLDPARPRALVYIKMADGKTVLLGSMFVAPKGQGPRPAGPLTDWHVHDNLCLTSTGAVALATGPRQCPTGAFFVGAAIEMMHVWLFDHPDGPFAHELTPAALRAAAQYATQHRH